MLRIIELVSKGSRYLIMQHFSRHRYNHHNAHKSDNIFLLIPVWREQPMLQIYFCSTI